MKNKYLKIIYKTFLYFCLNVVGAAVFQVIFALAWLYLPIFDNTFNPSFVFNSLSIVSMLVGDFLLTVFAKKITKDKFPAVFNVIILIFAVLTVFLIFNFWNYVTTEFWLH